MGKVIEIKKDVMFEGWSKPVTVVLLDNGQFATDECNQVVRIGDMVSLHARGGKKYGLVPFYKVLSD